MSLHGRGSVHSLAALKRVLVDTEEDPEVDARDFEDVKVELRTKAHNLTSVLMNPRETLMDSLLDDFAAEQSAPLDFSSSLSTTSSLSLSLFSAHFSSASTHTQQTHATLAHSSHHSAHNKSSHSAHSHSQHAEGSLSQTAVSLTLTQAELDSLALFARRMSQVSKMYLSLSHSQIHTQDTHTPLSPTHTQSDVTHAQRAAQDDLRTCYREVPSLFFSPSFSLLREEHFLEAMLGSAATRALSPHKPPTASVERGREKERDRDGASRLSEQEISTTTDPQSEELMSLFRSTHEDQDESLSRYLDSVEVALLRQIWVRSPAFLKALEDLHGLQLDVFEASRRLSLLRRSLSQSVSRLAHTLSVPRAQRRLRHESALWQRAHSMQRAVQGRALALSLIESEDFLSAQELLAEVRRAFEENELDKINSMRNIGESLAEMETAVYDVLCNRFVSTAVEWEDDTLDDTTHESASHSQTLITDSLESEKLGGLGGFGELGASLGLSGDLEASMMLRERQRESAQNVLQLVAALHRSDRLTETLSAHRERLGESVRLAVRTCVSEFVCADDSLSLTQPPAQTRAQSVREVNALDPLASLSRTQTHNTQAQAQPPSQAQRVRELSASQFLQCLSLSCESALWTLRRARAFHAQMRAALSQLAHTTLSDTSSTNTTDSSDTHTDTATQHTLTQPHEELQLTQESNEGSDIALDSTPSVSPLTPAQAKHYLALSEHSLVEACEIAQKTIAQLLNSRREATAKFEIADMNAFWTLSLSFLQEIERLSQRTAVALLQALLRQSRAFIEELHSGNKQKLVNCLEHERWTQCDVSRERQRDIESLALGRAAIARSAGNNEFNGSSQGVDSQALSPSKTTSSGVNVVSGVKEVRPVCVDGQEFRVVWSALCCVEVVQTLLGVARAFPLLASDCIARIAESLTLFSQRTRKLVLGAQAIQSAARLKSISAKHLALTSQSLSLLLALLPHFRAALLALLSSPKHHVLLAELDRVSQELLAHHAEVTSKFVSIVSDVLDHAALKLTPSSSSTSSVNAATQQGLSLSAGETASTKGSSTANTSKGTANNNGEKDGVSEYFDEITRNVSTLHKVLSALLPAREITDIFTRIFALLGRKVPTHLSTLSQTQSQPQTQSQSQAQTQRVLDEVQHCVLSLSRLRHVDGAALSSQLEDSVRARFTQSSAEGGASLATPPSVTAITEKVLVL